MTDRNDFGLMMMMRGVSPVATVSTKVKERTPFEAWTSWRMLGFTSEDRLAVADFDFDEDGFDVELERDDFREGDVVVHLVFDGHKLTAEVSPETFDAHATRISARDIGCGNEECDDCADVGIPVDLEILEDLAVPQLASFTDDGSDTGQGSPT